MSATVILLIVWVVLCVVVVAACGLGGRTDDRTARDAEREKYYTNLAGVYQHPRRHQ